MKRMVLCTACLAIALCSVAMAEPRAGLFRNAALTIADEAPVPVSLVGFHFRGGGGYGYGSGCGCDTAAPSCGLEPSCGAGPSCGGDYWGGYCGSAGRHHCHLFQHHRRCGSFCDTSCGCGAAAPSCGAEPSCAAAPSCGCDAGPACGCGRHSHFGHHLMCGHCGGGFGGCSYGCGCRCIGHAHRFWANGWCGQMGDGYCGGHPVDCSGGGMGAPSKAMPMPEAAPEPMEAAKSTRRPLFSPRPIGLGLQ